MPILLTMFWEIIDVKGVDFFVDSFYHFWLTVRFKGDCNGNRTHNHLVRKRTLNYLAKLDEWLRCVMSTYLYGAFTICFCHVTYAFGVNLLSKSKCDTNLKVPVHHKNTHLMHHMDKYSKYNLVIWSVSLNDWVFIYELEVVSSIPVTVS